MSADPDFPSILILEDSASTAGMVEAAIRAVMQPEVAIYHAPNLTEGHRLAEAIPFDFMILDIHLPEGTGLDFLCDVRMTHPDAIAVVMTAVPLPAYRELASRVGVVDFMPKPVDPNRLGELLKTSFPDYILQDAVEAGEASGATPAPAAAVPGRLRDLGFADVVQIKCMSGVSALLEFMGPSGETGLVGIRKGKVVHAAVDLVEGRDAFIELAKWGSDRFVEKTLPARIPESIDEDWKSLLKEAKS